MKRRHPGKKAGPVKIEEPEQEDYEEEEATPNSTFYC